MATSIVIKNYNHLNKSFGDWDTPEGKLVKNKDHYDRLMKENNMISYDKAMQQSKDSGLKPYVLSKNAWDIIKTAKQSKDNKGNVKLSDRTIDAMKKIGAIGKNIPKYMTREEMSTTKGGFLK